MQIVQIDTADRRQAGRFLDLPFSLYRNTPQWVPPLEGDARRMLDRRRHPFYRHSEAVFLLAVEADGRPVGRLALLDNRVYNEHNHKRTAFFYLFECVDSVDVAGALFQAGFDWARRRGLDHVLGPKGFAPLDGMGLLVQGFEHRPALGIPYNAAYYPGLLEGLGFAPLDEVVSGYMSARMPFPDMIHRASERIQKRRGLRVARFQSRKDLRAFVPRLQKLYNESLAGTVDNMPLGEEDARAMADQMLWFANPRLIKILMKDDEPVGFLFAYPDISAAVQRTRGRLFPFGWLDMLRELRRTAWVNINGAGMIEQYRGLGGTALLFSEMEKSIREGGFAHADLVQIGTDNERMQRELRDLGVDFYKTHRLYRREL